MPEPLTDWPAPPAPLPTPADLRQALEQIITEECDAQGGPITAERLNDIELRIGRLFLRWMGHTLKGEHDGKDR